MPVLGNAGGSLGSADTWLKPGARNAAAIGQYWEQRTAELIGDGQATVLHDLWVPKANHRANMDHVIVSGKQVWILDSKMWQAGFYWTRGGVTRRGFTREPKVDKKTMEMAFERTTRFLAGTGARVLKPTLIVWEKKNTRVSTWAARTPGAEIKKPDQVRGRIAKMMRTPADDEIVDRLITLLIS